MSCSIVVILPPPPRPYPVIQACEEGGQCDVLVKLDPFHWVKRWDGAIALSGDHELVKRFYFELRDIVFRPDATDYAREKARLQEVLGTKPTHSQILQGTRRIVPRVRGTGGIALCVV